MKAWNPRRRGIVVVDLDFGDGPSDREIIQAAVHGRMGALSTGDLEGGRGDWSGNPRGGLNGYPRNETVQKQRRVRTWPATKRRTQP